MRTKALTWTRVWVLASIDGFTGGLRLPGAGSGRELRALLEELTPRERHVVHLRFGLDGEDERTLEEIGRSLELTRERVRQICAEALDKLNRATRARRLEL